MKKYLLIITICLPSFGNTIKVRIIHTNDLHSSLLLPKVVTVIKREEASARLKNTLVLKFDAGDFFSGTLHAAPTVYDDTSASVEMGFFETLQYDAITLGNHEFDAGLHGFDHRLIRKSSGSVPIVSTIAEERLFEAYPGKIFPSKILKRAVSGKELKIGIVGAMGPSALEGSEFTRLNKGREPIKLGNGVLEFDSGQRLEFKETLAKTIQVLRPDVDLIVVLYHGGGHEDLAIANLEGVDLVLAGHTHASYFRRSTQGVPMMQSQDSGKNVGILDFRYNFADKKIENEKHRFVTVVDKPEDRAFLAKYWKPNQDQINAILRADKSQFLHYDDVVATYDCSNTPKTSYPTQVMSVLLKGLNRTLSEEGQPPADLYFSAIELTVRDALQCGKKYNYDEIVHAICGEGFRGNRQGFPIVTFYLTGKEIQRMLSALVGTARTLADALPAVSDNVTYVENQESTNILSSISQVRINNELIEPSRRYKVATNLFMAENLFFKWHQKISLPFIGPILNHWVGLRPTHVEGKKLNLKNMAAFDELVEQQGLPPEYVIFAKEFARANGKLE